MGVGSFVYDYLGMELFCLGFCGNGRWVLEKSFEESRR